MAVATAEDSRSPAWPPAMPFVVAGVIHVVALAVGANLLNDPDTYWHIAVGDWILAHDTGAYYFSTPFVYNSLPQVAVHGFRSMAGGLCFELLRAAAALG